MPGCVTLRKPLARIGSLFGALHGCTTIEVISTGSSFFSHAEVFRKCAEPFLRKIEISAKLLRILRQMVIECNWIWTAGKLILNSHFQSYSHQNLWNSVWGSGLKILSWKWKRWNCKIPRLIPEFYQFDTFFQIMHPPWNFQVSEIHFDITSNAVKTL